MFNNNAKRDAQPPEKKPYKIPKAMVPPRFVAANMRKINPPDITVHGIITAPVMSSLSPMRLDDITYR